VAYVLCLILFGLGYVALQPPFEGLDEFAHYSSLRQIAHTASLPTYGASYLDTETTDYQGPMPYGTGTPPFHALMGAKSYPEFFDNPANTNRYTHTYRTASQRSQFQESHVPNWQAQHPPLYYLLMTPLVWATDHLSFVSQIFVLRLVSYLLALGGVLFGLASIRSPGPSKVAAEVGFVFYPLLLPEFFPEFARIGNDSLCLLLSGCLLFLIANEKNPARRIRKPWLVGLVLGAGLLTKAFFLPLTAAATLWLVLCRIKASEGAFSKRILQMSDVAEILVYASVIGGWWYVDKFLTFGSITGGDEAIRLIQSGGMLEGLQKHFSAMAIARGLATIPVTWVWTGTWSLARLPTFMQLPLVLFALWVVAEFLNIFRRDRLENLSWLTVLMMAGLGFGLAHRTLQGIAVGGSGNQGGWYLHIMMPWVAIALGRGIWAILQRTVARYVFFVATIFALAFQIAAIWSEAALFTGCAIKGDDKMFHFSTGAYCLDQTSLVFGRLAIVAWPSVTLCALVAGVGIGLGGLCSARKSYLKSVVQE
jgi:hypothetical protein